MRMATVVEVQQLKVLDVESLISGLEDGIQDIDDLNDKFETVQRSIRDFHAMEEALSGPGGDSIRNFFNELYLPFLTYLYQSLSNYKSILENAQNSVESYESNPSGYVRQDFLESEVTDGFNNVKNRTSDLTEEANSILGSIDDLVSIRRIDDSEVQDAVEEGKSKTSTIIEDLQTMDRTEHTAMSPMKESLQTLRMYLADMEAKVSSGDLSLTNFNIHALMNLNGYSDIMDGIYGSDGGNILDVLSEKMENGETLTAEEEQMLYGYLRHEFLNAGSENEINEVVSFINEDNIEQLQDRLNNQVVVSNEGLEEEMVMVQAYLFLADHTYGEIEIPREDESKLRAYSIMLQDYHHALQGDTIGNVDMLNYVENPNDISGHYFETALETAEYDDSMKQFMTEEVFREEYMGENSKVLRIFELSEVTYYSSAAASDLRTMLENEGLTDELANYTSNFIGKQVVNKIISEVGRGAPIVQNWIEYSEGRRELEKDVTIGESQEVAGLLGMEFVISDGRSVPGRPQDTEVQLYPTGATYDMLERWKEVHELNPDFRTPTDEIESEDWYGITNYFRDHELEFDNDLQDYITHGTEVEGTKTLEELAQEHEGN